MSAFHGRDGSTRFGTYVNPTAPGHSGFGYDAVGRDSSEYRSRMVASATGNYHMNGGIPTVKIKGSVFSLRELNLWDRTTTDNGRDTLLRAHHSVTCFFNRVC